MNAKFNLTATFILFSFIAAYSQGGLEIDFPQKIINVYDNNGKPFVNKDYDIEGTPFFNDKWKFGTLKLTNDKNYNNILLKLNLQSQEVHFLNQNRSEMAVLPGTVKEIILTDTVNNQRILYDFRCGYSPVDNQNEKNFYLVLAEGKLSLLESLRKKVRETKDEISGAVKKEMITYEDYYLFTNGSLTSVRLNKSSILDKMGDQKNKVEDFAKSNNLSFKSGSDVKKLIEFYNSL
ncbi:MAG: hypothetical protein ABUT20_01435 [Bacteroidota bacterium]